jgi:NTP pyrophosphatase (non-canonical NTP hydrolase)
MEPLIAGASLPRIQDYVKNMEAERGLDGQDLTPQCLKLGEEVGELYRAVRKLQGEPQDPAGRIADLADEKEARNETRIWI